VEQVSPRELIDCAQTIDGENLATLAHGKAFTVHALDNGIQYTPTSTNKPRKQQYRGLAVVCGQFSRTNSFKPADYKDRTANASYALAVIDYYLRSRRPAT
jgi:hypothetical protein